MHPARSTTKPTIISASLPLMAVWRKNVRLGLAPNPLDSSAIEKTLVDRTVVTKTGTRSGRCFRIRWMMFPDSRSSPRDL
jgi:hypothetical protein